MAASCHDVDVPGKPTETGTALLETATGAIQGFAPINQIHQHLCAFHFYGDDMTRQVEAHHFCAHLNEDMRQCLIFDGPDAGARLIGLEYIVSEELFLTLPDEEKPLWHTHEFEVKSGVLFMPGVPGVVERRDLEKVAKTYGKTIHFWQVDRGDALPLGVPQIMMALTRDGQLRQDLADCTHVHIIVSVSCFGGVDDSVVGIVCFVCVHCRCGEEVRRVVPEGEGEQSVHERAGARHPPAGQRCWEGLEDGYPRGRSSNGDCWSQDFHLMSSTTSVSVRVYA